MNPTKDILALDWLIQASEREPLTNKVDQERFIRELIKFVAEHRPAGAQFGIPGKIPPRKMREHLSDLDRELRPLPKSRWKEKAEKFFAKRKEARSWIETVQCGLSAMLRATVERYPVHLDWPIYRSLKWNVDRARYEEVLDTTKDNLGNMPQAIFADLLLRYGHLIMTCKAPQPEKRGPKFADRVPTVKEPSKCGKVFVAKRTTGEYCSPRCKNRVLGRSKRLKERSDS